MLDLLTLVTLNVWVGQKLADLHTHLHQLIVDTNRPAVIALQEAHRYKGTPLDYNRRALDSSPVPDDGDCVLLVRHDIPIVHSGFIHVGPAGAWVGPKSQHDHHPPHVWPYVVLDFQGVHWTIVNVHRLAGKDHNGVAWHAEHIALREFLRSRSGPVVLLGDWNGRPGGKPAPDSISHLALVANCHTWFKGVDGAMYRDCTMKAADELPDKYGSDVHNPVVFEVTATGKIDPAQHPHPHAHHPDPVPAPVPPPPAPKPPVVITPPAPVYLGPPAHFTAGSNKPIRDIVIHATVSPCKRGQARVIAAYFRSAAAGGSSQYVVDPYEIVQAAYDSVICWAAPPNQGTLNFELCFFPFHALAKFKGLRFIAYPFWRLPKVRRMLQLAARNVAQAALAYDVPLVKIGAAELVHGVHGIQGHADRSEAFHQSTHWDPGAFPWGYFMKQVHAAAHDLKAGR